MSTIAAHNAHRVGQILGLVAKHGWGRYIDRMGLHKLAPRKGPAARIVLTSSARFRLLLEELGPTFVKFGQLLSVREDLFAEETIAELQKLQDAVPPFAPAEARKIVETELGRPISAMYATFDDHPLAAASIAQVHAATLRDGTHVVVKVQRPVIENLIQSDIEILFTCARMVQKHVPELRHFDPVSLVEEFAETILKELDFRLEGHNAERFAENFSQDSSVVVPRIFWELSAKRVLTQQRSVGRRTSEDYPASIAERRRLAEQFAQLYLTQLFEHGFFHGDPHPGNLFVSPDGRVCFHDFGIVGRLTPRDQDYLRQMALAVISRDAEALAEIYLTMGVAPAEADRQSFARDLGKSLESYYLASAHAYSFGEILRQFVRLGQHYQVKLPREWLLVVKSFMVVEAQAHALDNDFSMIDAIRRYVPRMLQSELLPDLTSANLLVRSYRTLGVVRSLAQIPETLARVLARLERGETTVRMRHERLDELEHHLDRASNRLSFSLIIAAIVIASSIVMAYGTGPHIEGIPMLGLAGYAIAAVLGLWWAIAILRSGRF